MSDPEELRVLHVFDHSIPLHSGYSFRSRYIYEVERSMGLRVEAVTSARHDVHQAPVEEIDGLRFHRTERPSGALDRLQLKLPFWRERILTGAMAARVEEVARDFRPHLLHAHSPFFDGQAALAVGRKLDLPVFYEIRAFWEDDAVDKGKFGEGGFVYRQVKRLETEVARDATRLVCICEGLKRDMIARGIPEEKILVSKNGVEVETFRPREKDPALERKFGLEGKRVLGFIGSFFVYEGLDDLVASAARLRAAGRDDFVLLLIGGGDAEPKVREAVARHGMEDRVVMPGRVPHQEIQDHYALIDTFVYPRTRSRLTELTTPLKPLEAMAMERCVIGSDVGGIRELLDECEVGASFRAGDAEDMDRVLAASLDRSLEDLREEGRRGRVNVARVRSWRGNLEPIVAAYREVLGRSPRPPAGRPKSAVL
ncbi:MAG: glycosyltransferase, exosortase A system-associated [Planctomycetota bacterium]